MSDDYRAMMAPREVSTMSVDAIIYFNKRLEESKADWRITPENYKELFGMVCIRCSARGYSNGVVINGGGGNTFDQTNIDETENAVDLNNTEQNHFTDTNINQNKAAEYVPLPEPKECRD